MARMHSRKKGQAGSTRPSKRSHPEWIRYKEKEVELLIAKLFKEGHSTSEIGILLRDTYGIPDIKKLCGKSVSKILSEKSLKPELPEDLLNLIRKVLMVRKHLELNHKDMTALRGIQLTESKIKRLVKYYKRTEKIPQNWKYDPESIGIYVS
jgi:small subunit ribosomal protein S15